MDSTGCVVQGMVRALETLLAKNLIWSAEERQRMEIQLEFCHEILKEAEAYQ